MATFKRADGTTVSFKSKRPKAPARTKAALERRLKKVPEALAAVAREKWLKARENKKGKK